MDVPEPRTVRRRRCGEEDSRVSLSPEDIELTRAFGPFAHGLCGGFRDFQVG